MLKEDVMTGGTQIHRINGGRSLLSTGLQIFDETSTTVSLSLEGEFCYSWMVM